MIKTLSFGLMHVSVAFVVVYAMTGDWLTGGLVALVEPCINTVAYHFHEKFWRRGVGERSGRAPVWGHAH